ncbi:amidohydrolase family protein [Bradyrhizobium sp. KBS0727]|uniref:amidohydrolase family protein n=1 Tax=unclassified Bradyrhizobium TaxID=2631580 RepID=UPI00110D5E19|nr:MULTISPECIES: amidohydrolase family protein [unclassified Bradyrhizobium]QDW37294.1 amidohydrolase family protein [Bradyrhizobium sp. KBS0725]QDW43897.1 amidohydrolase family protein [Bradyrhizobium sp. KBS0727]
MSAIDTLFQNARLADGRIVEIAVSGGRIVAIAPISQRYGTVGAIHDLGRRLVLPGMVEGHIHLDKCFIGDDWKPHRPCTAGFSVRERVKFEKEYLANARPIAVRAAALIDLCVSHGTTHMRSHVDVDAAVGLQHFEQIVAARDAHREKVSVQIVAFPQSGILTSPGTADLLEQAVRAGADLVGGLDPAGHDGDAAGHLDIIFGIAERHGVGIDIHLHDGGLQGIAEIEEIARRTKAAGLGGKVTISHAYALGEVSHDLVQRTAQRLAEAGVAILTNAPGARPFPPVLLLRDAGVNVFSGNDNIRDSWWPYGDGDLLERAMLVGYRSGFNTDDQLAAAFDMVTSNAASALGLTNHGLTVGGTADFVVLDARHVQEAVVARPKPRDVYKNGRLVACGGTVVAAAA